MTNLLVDALVHPDTDDSFQVRVGTVSSTSPCEVTISGQAGLIAAYLSSYTPTLSDQVMIGVTSTDLIILGKIISGG